ncbi:MAG TPA: ATP-binding protein [Bryobacteraceae bacterium]|nr:ATP-binding protein [Bryobacteraceae bacterium]
MSASTAQLQQSTIRQYTLQLRLPTVGGQFLKMAEEAGKQKLGHVAYLEALLAAEVEERERNAVARRIQESKFPKVKTLEDFHFDEAPLIPAAQIRKLAEGGYLSRSEPIVLVGETVKQARGKRTWRPDWQWKPVGSGSGCDSRRRPSW